MFAISIVFQTWRWVEYGHLYKPQQGPDFSRWLNVLGLQTPIYFALCNQRHIREPNSPNSWLLPFYNYPQSRGFTTVGSQRPREIFNFFFSIFFPPSSPLAPAHARAHDPRQMGMRRAPDRGIAPGADRTNLLEAAFPPMCSGARAMSVRWRPLSSPPSPSVGQVTAVECVCWLFIFKDTEPSPLQDSFSVRQQGGLPGPPPRSPSSRIHRRPGVLPLTAQHYCPVTVPAGVIL